MVSNINKRATAVCVKCRVIRSFILCVLMLMILAFVLGDDVAYFRIFNPELAALLILGGGTLIFLWKVLEYYLSRNN